MVKLELTDLNKSSVYIGSKLNVCAKFTFEEDTDLLWTGIILITNPPCAKELQVVKEEIFSKGRFEAGNYIREKSLLIKSNFVPTIRNRDLIYVLKLILRQPNPINPEKDLIINKSQDIEILPRNSGQLVKKSNPISFSISGLSTLLTKDIFKPGETIKISFTSEELKFIEVRLLQHSNLVCYCEADGKNCRRVEELPPAIAGDAKTKDIEKGYLFLKVPEIAEPSHNYLWSPSEKEQFGFRYGAYTKWTLSIIGKKKPEYGLEQIKFDVPITITTGRISERKRGIDLFAEGTSGASSLFDGISKFQKIYKVLSIDSDVENYILRIKNISNKDLEGVTVKVTGLQEGIFETAPNLTGFSLWKKDEEKEIVYETKQNITALISILEDNSQKRIKVQSPISTGLF